MKAKVRINGTVHTLNVTHIDTTQPDCRYGQVVYRRVRYEVAESITLHQSDGHQEKQWEARSPILPGKSDTLV